MLSRIKEFINRTTLKRYMLVLAGAMVLLFLYLFQNLIMTGIEWKEEKEKFIEACDFEDGIAFQSTSARGKPQLTCVYRGILINVDPQITLQEKLAYQRYKAEK